MSIKGTTQELYVGKSEVNIITFLGNKISIPYSSIKRIDYCFAERFKSGFMSFITLENGINKFEFGEKANDPVRRTIDFIKQYFPSMNFRECEFKETEKDRSVYIIPVFGHKELGMPSKGFTIHQKLTGEVYLNKDTRTFYSLAGYEWEGPEFEKVTKYSQKGTSDSETIKKGKALKIGAGAILGNLVASGAGAVVGMAMGAAGKGKSKTIAKNSIDSIKTSGNSEKDTNGIIALKSHDDGKTYRISFLCSRELDAKIKCFDFEQEQTKEDLITDTKKSLEGIKALKELLDMGAITQEEFNRKKKEILNM